QGTRVLDGGDLNLGSGLTTLNEPLFLNGDGITTGEAATGALSLPAGAASATVAGPIAIESDADINVAAGGALTLARPIAGTPAAPHTKEGEGELRYGFADPITFIGTTNVEAGLLTLNTPGKNAILGSLVLGPGSTSAPTVRLLGTTIFIGGIPFPVPGN